MKTTKRLLAIAIAALAFGACQKENSNVIFIEAEGMHNGTKMAIDGNHSYWANGDQVRIKGANDELFENYYEININNNQATIDVSSNESLRTPICGIYPSSIYPAHFRDNIYVVNLPGTYTYNITYVNSVEKQNLQTPMMAYTENGNTLLFKHLTGAVTVEITNDFGIDVRVTDITVSSNLYQLCGQRYIDITNITHDATDADTAQTDNVDYRKVQMTFGGTAQLIIPSGQTKQVQLPVLPVGRLNKFTISVTVQNKDDVEMEYTFTKTQASSHALLRAQIGYAPAKFGGKFNYNGGYVRFAPGNLQYNAYYNTWRFAKHQYDVIGNAAGNTTSEGRETQPNWIDLFGYGTSGNSDGPSPAYQPWATSTTPTDYYSNFLTDYYGHLDWGVENSITNGVIDWTAEWRTPNWSEITSNNTIAIANVNNIFGLIILPEGYSHPLEGAIITLPDVGNNDFNATQWKKMEVAGAIFLPAAGKRNGTTVTDVNTTGYYWSNSGNGVGTANALKIMSDIWNFNNVGEDASNGFAVRLVRVNN